MVLGSTPIIIGIRILTLTHITFMATTWGIPPGTMIGITAGDGIPGGSLPWYLWILTESTVRVDVARV